MYRYAYKFFNNTIIYCAFTIQCTSIKFIMFAFVSLFLLYAFKIYNLIVPVLLVAFTGIASVFIPTQTDSKLNVPITVVLTFIFLQALVASMSPKTPISPIVRLIHSISRNINFNIIQNKS